MDWKITIWQSEECLDVIFVPQHRMSEKAVKEYAKALLARFMTAEELKLCHLNARSGGPFRSTELDPQRDATATRFCISIGTNPNATIQVEERKAA